MGVFHLTEVPLRRLTQNNTVQVQVQVQVTTSQRPASPHPWNSLCTLVRHTLLAVLAMHTYLCLGTSCVLLLRWARQTLTAELPSNAYPRCDARAHKAGDDAPFYPPPPGNACALAPPAART